MLREHWQIFVVCATSVLVVSLVPAKKLMARISGEEVTLRTRPFDPYDLLAGYYETLTYEVEFPPEDKRAADLTDGQTVFIIIERDEEAWGLVRVVGSEPTGGEVFLRAEWDGRRARLDTIRRFYIPEAKRHHIDGLMRESRGRGLVDLRVDDAGNAVLLELHIGGESFSG